MSIRAFTRFVAAVIVAFVLADVGIALVELATGHDYILGLVPMLSLNHESSLSTWYASLSLAFSALLLAIIHRHHAKNGDRFAGHWLGLAIVFVFLSADEAAMIHELVNTAIREYVAPLDLAFGQWTFAYVALLLVFSWFYVPFLGSLWPAPARAFLVAGGVFLTGAIGLELVGAIYVTANEAVPWHRPLVIIEETLEMTGILLWMRALLQYMSTKDIALRLRASP